ncbi:LytR/AlgR family response regulator transcription factor, partial [Streptomyces albidochromogenes]|uniref:LytR/AlgR family response regulator transcription factor n=1 Tax=Streptomyces albidochromogenes TaxID=329524 RepID=UPI001FCC4C64
LTVDTDGTGLDVGVALALGGGVLLLLAAVLLPGRRRRRRVDPVAQQSAADQIAVELGGVTRFVPIDDIAYVEAQGDYARLHTHAGSHLVRIPLSTLEERWAARGFVRIHRRHLVALGRIDELRLDAGATTVRVGDAELAVSRRHARELRDLLMRRAHG